MKTAWYLLFRESTLFSWCKTNTLIFRQVKKLPFRLPSVFSLQPGSIYSWTSSFKGNGKIYVQCFPRVFKQPFLPCGNLSLCQSNFKAASISLRREKKVLQNASYQGDMLAYLFLVGPWPPSSLTVSFKDHQGNSPGDNMVSNTRDLIFFTSTIVTTEKGWCCS